MLDGTLAAGRQVKVIPSVSRRAFTGKQHLKPEGVEDMSQNTSRQTASYQESNRAAQLNEERRTTAAEAAEAAVMCLKQYARERPEFVALWTFGIGFVVGWKLKPW